jgi:hypothetical protein
MLAGAFVGPRQRTLGRPLGRWSLFSESLNFNKIPRTSQPRPDSFILGFSCNVDLITISSICRFPLVKRGEWLSQCPRKVLTLEYTPQFMLYAAGE